MMTTIKITRILIDQITSVEVGGIQAFSEIDMTKRTITIWTVNGDKYELILESDKIENLDLKKKDDDGWLMPKVYKGKSMSEEEEED
jgi:hypothetical protein